MFRAYLLYRPLPSADSVLFLFQVEDVPNRPQKMDDLDDSLDSSTASPFDHIAVYKQVLEHMEPGETVAKTLRRLGGNKSLSASERLRRKKAGLSIESSGDASKVTELTELANRILTKTGNMNVYQESYQHIKNMVRIQTLWILHFSVRSLSENSFLNKRKLSQNKSTSSGFEMLSDIQAVAMALLPENLHKF